MLESLKTVSFHEFQASRLGAVSWLGHSASNGIGRVEIHKRCVFGLNKDGCRLVAIMRSRMGVVADDSLLHPFWHLCAG